MTNLVFTDKEQQFLDVITAEMVHHAKETGDMTVNMSTIEAAKDRIQERLINVMNDEQVMNEVVGDMGMRIWNEVRK